MLAKARRSRSSATTAPRRRPAPPRWPRPPPASQPRVMRATTSSPRRQSRIAAAASRSCSMPPGGGGQQLLEARIVEPAEQQRGEGRRSRGPQDQRHVDDREGEGEHGIDRQAKLAVEDRQDHLQPGRRRPIAEAARDIEGARDRQLVHPGEDGEQEEGRLLEPEPGGQRQAETIAGNGEIGRPPSPAGAALPDGRASRWAR